MGGQLFSHPEGHRNAHGDRINELPLHVSSANTHTHRYKHIHAHIQTHTHRLKFDQKYVHKNLQHVICIILYMTMYSYIRTHITLPM